MSSINSNAYWSERFRSGDWESQGGEQQSAFFAALALSALPDWLTAAMQQNAWSVADHGCAEGAGTALLAGHFPKCSFTGTDFSADAVELARQQYPNCAFQTVDLVEDALPAADVVFSSNVLEHLTACAPVLEKLVQSAARYAVILVPFEDDSGIAEHVNQFDIRFFPETVADRHYLRHFRVLDCRDLPQTQWNGKQLLLIYANRAHDDGAAVRMAELYENGLAQMIEEQHSLAVQLREAQSALENSQEWNRKQYQLLQEECAEKLREQANAHREETERSEQARQEEAAQREHAQRRADSCAHRTEIYRRRYDALRESSLTRAQTQAVYKTFSDACDSLEREYDAQKKRNTVLTNQLLYRIATVRSSLIYRGAHLLTELAHLFTGPAEDRRAVWRWLVRDRGAATKYHYLHEISQGVSRVYAQTQAETLDFSVLQPERVVSASEELRRLQRQDAEEEAFFALLDDMFARADADFIVVMPPVIDWNVPLFQRPQQLAMAFAQQGILCFYGTANVIDHVSAPQEIIPNCVVVLEEHMQPIREMARAYGKRIVLDLWSTDNAHYDAYLAQWEDAAILYEYIDEISDEITGTVPRETRLRHAQFLSSPSVYVVATAEKLYREVLQLRGSEQRALCSGNGVDLAHFQVVKDPARVPESLQDLVLEGRPIIGYFGAIANWVDYDLLIYAAQQRPDYRFLLIGPRYGAHTLPQMERLSQLPNVFMPGTIRYQQLPYVAQYFTVATIPFLLNEITESTSPIKLFEYMAMGKPVVTTAMPECRKYPEVCIAGTPEEYVALLDRCVEQATGPERAELAQRMVAAAEKNSWTEKAREIADLLST